MEAGATWYLRKHEGNATFGPLTFDQLARWAATARIAPHDCISTDELSWMKAPMLPELGMDWLVEVTSERLYGPTTLGAVQEFLRLGEVLPDAGVINTRDGSRHSAAEVARADVTPTPEVDENGITPVSSRLSIGFPERIRDLERALGEERFAQRELEERYRDLQARYDALAGEGS